MSQPVLVVGMGPGSEEYLTPRARKAINEAQVLVGGHRWLKATSHLNKEQVALSNPLEETLNYIKKTRANKRIAVLVSGDTGIHSLLPRLRESIGEELLEIIPGISSIQLAFAQLKKNWENARILSLHGRKLAGIEQEISSSPLVVLFSDAQNTPAKIARYLQKKSITSRTVYICYNLSYPDEKIIKTDLINMSEIAPTKNFFLIIEEEKNAK